MGADHAMFSQAWHTLLTVGKNGNGDAGAISVADASRN